MSSPFLYLAGHRIDRWDSCTYSTALPDRPYMIDLGDTASLSLSPNDAQRLLIDLARLMYDNNDLTLKTADALHYLGYSAGENLRDRREKCPNCNGNGATGPDYDPDSCQACRGTGWKDN